jgi:hypothetical protein
MRQDIGRPPAQVGPEYLCNRLHKLRANESGCEAEVRLLGGAEKRAHIRVGLESGISSISGNDRDVGDGRSRARNPALERNHWGQRVRFEGKGDERQRPCVGDQAARPSADKTEPTQGAARRATAIPTTSTIPLVSPYGRATVNPSAAQHLSLVEGLGETKVKQEKF